MAAMAALASVVTIAKVSSSIVPCRRGVTEVRHPRGGLAMKSLLLAVLGLASLAAGCAAPQPAADDAAFRPTATPAEERPPGRFEPRFSAPEYLDRAAWPVIFDLPSFGIEHQQTAVVTELTTGHRQYQTAFLSSSMGGGPVCCIAQLWAEEGPLAPAIADLPLARFAEKDVGRVVAPRREGAPGRLEEPAVDYLPFTGPFGGDTWGCFVFRSDVVMVLRGSASESLVYHGYFCRRGKHPPDEGTVTTVMKNLKVSGG
jgi:hypothetical protein